MVKVIFKKEPKHSSFGIGKIGFVFGEEVIIYGEKWPEKMDKIMDKAGFSYARPWTTIYNLGTFMKNLKIGKNEVMVKEGSTHISLNELALDIDIAEFRELYAELQKLRSAFVKRGLESEFILISNLIDFLIRKAKK